MNRWMTDGLEHRELEADLPELLNPPPPLNFLKVRRAVPLTIPMLSSQFLLLPTPKLRQQQAKLNWRQPNAGYLVQIRQVISSCVLERCFPHKVSWEKDNWQNFQTKSQILGVGVNKAGVHRNQVDKRWGAVCHWISGESGS